MDNVVRIIQALYFMHLHSWTVPRTCACQLHANIDSVSILFDVEMIQHLLTYSYLATYLAATQLEAFLAVLRQTGSIYHQIHSYTP